MYYLMIMSSYAYYMRLASLNDNFTLHTISIIREFFKLIYFDTFCIVHRSSHIAVKNTIKIAI